MKKTQSKSMLAKQELLTPANGKKRNISCHELEMDRLRLVCACCVAVSVIAGFCAGLLVGLGSVN